MGGFEDEARASLGDEIETDWDGLLSWDNRHFRALLFAFVMGMLFLWEVGNVYDFFRHATRTMSERAEEDKADAAEWGRTIGIEHGYHKGFRKGYASRMSEETEAKAGADGAPAKVR